MSGALLSPRGSEALRDEGAAGGAAAAAGVTSFNGRTGAIVFPSLPPGVRTIMPLGDSQTVGSGGDAGYPATGGNIQIMEGIGGDATSSYRDRLFDLLRDDGFNVTGPLGDGFDTQFFRGSQSSTSFNSVARKHEGHSGWGFSTLGGFVGAGAAIASQFPALWAANPASMVILMCGVNDLNNGASGAQAAASMAVCLQQIATTAGNNTPVLYVYPPMGSAVSAKQAAFKAAGDPVIATQVAAGQKVWSCDASSILKDGNGGTAGSMFHDSLHPGYHGYRLLAGIIHRGLISYPF